MMLNLQKIVIVPDKFKGSLTSLEVAKSIQLGIIKGNPNLSIDFSIIPIADGGDGSMDVIEQYLDNNNISYTIYNSKVHNPLGKIIDAPIVIYNKIAFIEMAKVSGITLLEDNEKNPLKTSTYGLGELIKEAIKLKVNEIYLSIGGSSTNDCGVGMLQALGYKFYDSTDKLFNKIIAGEDLIKIKRITSPSNLHLPKINVICDVNNPLFGEQGATYIYGKQKGGNDISLPLLEEGVINFSSLSKNKNIALTPGAGAAGGVGYACIEYLNGKLIPGNEYFMRLVNLEEKIKDANLVITGEGKLDNQTFYGKAIEGVYKLSNYFNKDLIIICGVNMLPQELSLNNVKILAISDIEKDINKSMCNAENLIMELTSNIKLE